MWSRGFDINWEICCSLYSLYLWLYFWTVEDSSVGQRLLISYSCGHPHLPSAIAPETNSYLGREERDGFHFSRCSLWMIMYATRILCVVAEEEKEAASFSLMWGIPFGHERKMEYGGGHGKHISRKRQNKWDRGWDLVGLTKSTSRTNLPGCHIPKHA